MSINAEFRVRRERCGATQLDLAKRAGVTAQTVKLWERGFYPIPSYGMAALEGLEADLESWVLFTEQCADGDRCRADGSRVVRIPFFRTQDDLDLYLSTLAPTDALKTFLLGHSDGGALPDDGECAISTGRANVLLTASADALAERGVAVERYYVDELASSTQLQAARPLFAEKEGPQASSAFFDPAAGTREMS